MGTYARDLKTLMRFFMKRKYLPRFEIPLPKASKTPIQTYTDDELKKLLKKPDVRKCIQRRCCQQFPSRIFQHAEGSVKS